MQRLREDAVTEPDRARRLPGDRAAGRGWPLPRAEGDRVNACDARGHSSRARAAARRAEGLERRAHARITSTASSAHNAALNAFITVDREKSLAQAKAADARIARGEAAPLTGIPVAHKDLFCAKGWRTTAGSKILANFVAPYDAHVIEQFDRAGAVLLGKTNMDEFAMGSSNENSAFGPVKNPWDACRGARGQLGRVGGGGRGAPGARGHRHRHGRLDPPARVVHRRERPASHLRARLALRHGGLRLLARPGRARSRSSAEDLALVLDVMAGFDARDSTCIDRPEGRLRGRPRARA